MKIAIGSTRAGLELKDDLKRYLEGLGHSVDDLGMQEGGQFIPYHVVAATIAAEVSKGKYPRAIIVCGTGAGSAIVANKFKNVYAVQASSEYEGKRATIINNANILTLGEWITPPHHAREIVKAWLEAAFTDGFEPQWQEFLADAYEQVRKLESENLK